jgi:hypothetical protein
MLGRKYWAETPLSADCQKALPLCAISFATAVKRGQLALQAGLPDFASEKPDERIWLRKSGSSGSTRAFTAYSYSAAKLSAQNGRT